jgi:hypothetical protein
MTLLSHNLRLTAAYVFEKRNCSPVPVIQLDLFITEIPVSKYESSFRLWTINVNLPMLSLPTIPVRTCKLCVISHYLGMPPPENNYYNEVILNDPTLTVNNPVEGHEIQIFIGSSSKVAKGTLIEFAKKLTEHTRVNPGLERRTRNRGV